MLRRRSSGMAAAIAWSFASLASVGAAQLGVPRTNDVLVYVNYRQGDPDVGASEVGEFRDAVNAAVHLPHQPRAIVLQRYRAGTWWDLVLIPGARTFEDAQAAFFTAYQSVLASSVVLLDKVPISADGLPRGVGMTMMAVRGPDGFAKGEIATVLPEGDLPIVMSIASVVNVQVPPMLLVTQSKCPSSATGHDDPCQPDQHQLAFVSANMNAPPTGVTVAVLDTGVDANHPDLVNKIVATSPSLTDGGGGHGTHVAGIIAAEAKNGIGIRGVEASARVLSYKVIDPNVQGDSAVIAALDDIASRAATDTSIRVVNCSWTNNPASTASPVQESKLADLGKMGIVVVAGAGDSGNPNNVYAVYPAGYRLTNLIAVGGTEESGPGRCWSNYGGTVSIVAPGCDILSTINGDYARVSGTSMAAPHVSAAAATLFGICPKLAAADVKTALEQSATLASGWTTATSSLGVLNVAAAIKFVQGMSVCQASMNPGSVPPN
jgi:Subtilase family